MGRFARRLLEDLWQDTMHGVRLLRRSPVFTATAMLSLAIGIGANTALFTVANALLVRPPAGIADPPALVVIGTARGDGGLNPVGYATYLEVARRTTTLSSTFAEDLFPHVMGLMVPGSRTAEAAVGQRVTTTFFTTLGATPSLGRLLRESDDAAAVLEHGYWLRRFNGDPGVLGAILRLNGEPVTIVGIAAPGFQGTGIQRCDLWLSIGRSKTHGTVMAGGRLRPGTTLETAAAELTAIGHTIDAERGTPANRRTDLNALALSRAGANRKLVVGFTTALMVLVSIVLAVACANVAGIMLTRASARARELALRSALGARRGRLVRQLLTETTLLFLLGCLVGIGLAEGLIRAMALMLSASVSVPLVLDWRVLIFAVSMSVAAAMAFGVLPAITGSKVDSGAWLKDGAGTTQGRSRLRGVFVVSQIAASVLLVTLAASFARVLIHAGGASPGFDPRDVDLATIDLSVTGEPNATPGVIWPTLLDQTRQLPGVESASLARVPPGGLEGIGLGGVAPAGTAGPGAVVSPGWNIVDTGYFATLRIPLVAGRDFAPGDTLGSPPVVVVSRTLAQRFWPGQSAVGKGVRLAVYSAKEGQIERHATVVGVAGDIKSSSLVDGLAEPYVYLPLAQSDTLGADDMTTRMSIVVRRRAGVNLAGDLGTVVHGVDPRLVLPRVESLSDAVAFGLTPQRVLARLGGAMGLVALALASMGIYGVAAYTVALRRREFAIRLALGARPLQVVRMVFRQGAALVAAGLAMGLPVAIGAGHVLSVFLYDQPAAHVPTLVATVLLFVAIGATASIVPAGQAVREGWRRALHED